MNRVTLIGYLGQDAGVHFTKTNQTPYTILSLATKRTWERPPNWPVRRQNRLASLHCLG